MIGIESLESRRLMSASLNGGVLSVVGTDNADNIALTVSNNKIVVKRNNVTEGQFNVGSVNAISINAKGNNDKVTIADNIFKPATIDGGTGNDELKGGSGNDLVKGHDGNDTVDGGKGNDDLRGNGGTDTVTYASRTNDVYVDLGSSGGQLNIGESDQLNEDIENATGGSGNDNISGSSKNNRLRGGGGNDTLFGESGNDTLEGDGGNDTLIDFLGKTVHKGGSGTDTVEYTQHSFGVMISNDGVANDGEFNEGDNIHTDVENLTGSNSHDNIFGNSANNVLRGLDGNDSLQGNAGYDKMYGGNGNDWIFAKDGVANEIVDGGAGTDKADIDWIYYPYGAGANDSVTGVESFYAP